MELDKVCRLCAKNENLVSLEESSEELIEKIYQCTSVIIKNEIGLPYYICNTCQRIILKMYDFRESCIKTQTFLMNRGIDEGKVNIYNYFEECSESEDIIEEFIVNFDEHEMKIEENANEEEKNLENEEETSSAKHKRKSRQTRHLPEEERKSRYQALLRPCDMCGKMVEKSRMQSHINQHLGLQPYMCDVEACDKTFYCPYMLTNHKRNHHSDKNYCCDVCGKSYRLQKSLYNHKQKHKEPRYQCNFCDRKYKNSTYLKQHMRKHTGERPYECTICPRSFATSYNLKAHVRSHTKEKPYICTRCGISYGYNSLLKSHTEKCHLTEEQFLATE